MNFQNNCNFSFLDLIESILDTHCDFEYETNNSYDYENGLISRGLPSANGETRKELGLQILKKQKRKTLIQNIDLLKNLIQQKNEEESLILLAKIINNVTTREQKMTFINELRFDKKRSENAANEYYHDNTCVGYDHLVPRSTAPEIYNSDSLNSSKPNSNCYSNQFGNHTSEDQFLIHKGVYYCRVLLSNFFREKDNSFIQDLKSRNILHYVLNEQIDNQKSYLMDLVDHYPLSYQEILFILKEDEKLILDSSIFILLAEKNMNQLYDFLSKLSNDKIDKNKLSQACEKSSFNGYRVSHIISKNKKPEEAVSCVKIETFLNRHKYQKNG